MSIEHVSEKEQRLAHHLAEAQRIIERLVGERDANARLFLEDIKTVEAERDALRSELNLLKYHSRNVTMQVLDERDEYQVAADQLAVENKVLRDALEQEKVGKDLLEASNAAIKRMLIEAEKDTGLRLLTCRSLFRLARGEINAQHKVLASIKQEAETGLVIGDDIGMRDALTQILREADDHFGIITLEGTS